VLRAAEVNETNEAQGNMWPRGSRAAKMRSATPTFTFGKANFNSVHSFLVRLLTLLTLRLFLAMIPPMGPEFQSWKCLRSYETYALNSSRGVFFKCWQLLIWSMNSLLLLNSVVHYHVFWNSFPSQLNSVQNLHMPFYKIHFNIVLLSTPTPAKWSLSLRISD
jgi:hypothetical protein